MTNPDIPRCECGDPIMQIDLRSLPFATRSGPRWWWVHVDKYRNLSHQARPQEPRRQGLREP